MFLLTTIAILYLLPTQQRFAYDFKKGDQWNYETLYAPFDFAIIKSQEDLEEEKQFLRKTALVYFDVDTLVLTRVLNQYSQSFSDYIPQEVANYNKNESYSQGVDLLKNIYAHGVLPLNYTHLGGEDVALLTGRIERDVRFEELINLVDLSQYLISVENKTGVKTQYYYKLFFDILQPNLTLNKAFTQKELNLRFDQISLTRDVVAVGQNIISKGDFIDENRWKILRSLQQQYDLSNAINSSYVWTNVGYFIIIALVLQILLLFTFQYRKSIFENNTKITFLFFNVLFMVGMSTAILRYDASYLYALPVCIFPLITKAFFDARLGLFIHVLSVIIVGFITPNNFEYMVLQILAGMVTILSASELYKRAKLFLTVMQITLVYLFAYMCFVLIRQGSISQIDPMQLGMFVVSGMLTLFVQPLIYLYEKVFSLVSDVSLLELSDTNSGLFKTLSDQAPGTFHHSLQVANLAEAAAVKIGANVLLTRVGALYHDIGKINRPIYFSENQRSKVSPHDDLSPQESAKIIIQHVIEGVEKAKKYNLPDRIIDFIRTHHGTSKVYFFYKKALAIDPETSVEAFTYPGPKPFSKETAIVMMADAIEAATKSLVSPSVDELTQFVNKIIANQMKEAQFIDANITLAEIEKVKKVMVSKLINVYHLRIAYPE